MAILHHAFLYSEAEFLERVAPCWKNGSLVSGALHAAAVRATLSSMATQRDLLELIRFEPVWWLERGVDEEPFRWLILVLSAVPSLRRAPCLGRIASGLSLLHVALTALSWDPRYVERLSQGRRLDAVLVERGFQVSEAIARGFRLMPGRLSPVDATELLRRLVAVREDAGAKTTMRRAIEAYGNDHGLPTIPSATDLLDDSRVMLEASIQSGDCLLLGVFD